jgi:hypothetical protein
MNTFFRVGLMPILVLTLAAGCASAPRKDQARAPVIPKKMAEPLPAIVVSETIFQPPPKPVIPEPVVVVPPPPPKPAIPNPADIAEFSQASAAGWQDQAEKPVSIPADGLSECRFTNIGDRIKLLLGSRVTVLPFVGQVSKQLELKAFCPYFVFDISKSDSGQTLYLIGSTPLKKDIEVWVLAENVCYWDNPYGDRSIKSQLAVYATDIELVAQISEGDASNVQPTAEIVNTQAVYPIVKIVDQKVNGADCSLHQIVFLNQLGNLQSGWIAAKVGDETYVEPMVYTAVAEIRVLLANLYLLAESLEKPENIRRLEPRLSGAYRQVPYPLLFLTDEGVLGMDVWLLVRSIPVKNNGVLNLTKVKIETMPQTERLYLSRYLRENTIPGLEAELNSARWCFGTTEVRFGWIRYAALP